MMTESASTSGDVVLLQPSEFRSFYDEALPIVYGYFYKRCGGRADIAEELTQDTFLAGIRALRRGVDVRAPLPWIITIARRRLVDYYRARRRRAARVAETPMHHEMAHDSPLEVTWNSEPDLVEALAALRAPHRLALILRYVDDLPVEVVASEMGRSIRATESLLVRARSAFSRAYGEINGRT